VTRPRRLVRLAALAASLAALAGCNEKPVDKKAGPPPVLITVTQARTAPLDVVERTLGTLEAVVDPKIAAEVAGRITKIAARSGQSVRKGQQLAEIDATDASGQQQADQAEVARLEALLAQQERVLARQNELVARGFISRNAADDARAQRDALQGQLAAARARGTLSAHALGRTRVLSPVDGSIEVQIVSVGDYVKVGDPLFRLISNHRLRANLPFPERIAGRLQPGQAVRLRSPLLPGKVIESRIESLLPTLTETSRAVEAVVRFDRAEWGDALRGGGSVDAEVVVAHKPAAILVPEQSVALRPAGKVVYQIVDGKARQRQIEAGVRQDGMVEVLDGIAAGDTIALDGAGFLSDGATVSVQDRAAPAAR
jgi:RND family efflux transporter MFP subunit